MLLLQTTAQNLAWAKKLGGTNDGGRSIFTDAAGNVYTTGQFDATSDFDPGPGVFNLTAAGSSDIFVSKLDAAGNFVWAKAMGGIAYEESQSIALDALGHVYVAGYFYSPSISFGSNTLTNPNSKDSTADIFIAKLDNITGIEIEEHNNGVSVYPNPATDYFNIIAPSFTNSTLTLYDISGRVFLHQLFNTKAKLYLRGLAIGVYIAEIKSKEGSSVKVKVIKE